MGSSLNKNGKLKQFNGRNKRSNDMIYNSVLTVVQNQHDNQMLCNAEKRK